MFELGRKEKLGEESLPVEEFSIILRDPRMERFLLLLCTEKLNLPISCRVRAIRSSVFDGMGALSNTGWFLCLLSVGYRMGCCESQIMIVF